MLEVVFSYGLTSHKSTRCRSSQLLLCFFAAATVCDSGHSDVNGHPENGDLERCTLMPRRYPVPKAACWVNWLATHWAALLNFSLRKKFDESIRMAFVNLQMEEHGALLPASQPTTQRWR